MNAAEQLDHTPLKKGQYGTKHKSGGLTPSQVAELDPAWLVWAYEAWNPKPCSQLLYRECVKEIEEGQRQNRVARDQDE